MSLERHQSRVMIVEDDDDIRVSITQILKDCDYTVDAAANGQEALDMLEQSSELPRVILLDLTMPVMDGVQFCVAKSEKEALKKIPVVMMSAAGQMEAKMPHEFVSESLKKPMTIEALIATVSKYCG